MFFSDYRNKVRDIDKTMFICKCVNIILTVTSKSMHFIDPILKGYNLLEGQNKAQKQFKKQLNEDSI